jgi:hypothetical protein
MARNRADNLGKMRGEEAKRPCNVTDGCIRQGHQRKGCHAEKFPWNRMKGVTDEKGKRKDA